MPRLTHINKSLNLLIEADLIQKAKDHDLDISKFLEIKLQEYL
jgi:post-segregation antitoxin (ccd killing protein)